MRYSLNKKIGEDRRRMSGEISSDYSLGSYISLVEDWKI